MPVKVIFIAATVIVAAGMVVYENREHVYEFVDRTRRKVADSLQALAEEINPHREPVALSSRGSFSGSTAQREDSSEKRGHEVRPEGECSFSKEDEAYGLASSSGRDQFYNESNATAGSFRHRAQQFSPVPENLVVFDAATESSRVSSSSPAPIKVYDVVSCHSSPSTPYQEKQLPQMPADLPPALPPKPQSLISDSQQSGVILEPFTDAAVVQNLASEQILAQTKNTPPPQTISSTGDQEEHAFNPFESSQPYWSIHEWANTTHTPTSSSPSLAGSVAEEVDQLADDILSDFGSEIGSVGSWTEVGSSVSGDDN